MKVMRDLQCPCVSIAGQRWNLVYPEIHRDGVCHWSWAKGNEPASPPHMTVSSPAWENLQTPLIHIVILQVFM